LRRSKSMTQEELATAVGRTVEAVSNIERGKSLPSLGTLMAIAEALDAPVRDLFPPEDAPVQAGAKRLNLEAQALRTLRQLTDSQLGVAVAQLQALADQVI
jgi:transcriptional regulator with XRE-family HTH domain